MKLYSGGYIRPFADERTVEALLIEGGLIKFAGPLAEALALVSEAQRADLSHTDLSHTDLSYIDLAGASLFAGFTDAHVHVWKVGQLAAPC